MSNKLLQCIWQHLPLSVRKEYTIFKSKSQYKKNLGDYYSKYEIDSPPIFEAIEIETVNRCNGKCSFCPVNANEPQRPYAKMTDELFKKIIGELKEMDFTDMISLFSNNEPFIDERIEDFAAYERDVKGRMVHTVHERKSAHDRET